MTKYYVNDNAQPTGEHEIHEESCWFLPVLKNRRYLGEFFSFADAKKAAEQLYDNVDGCAYCCPEGHTK